MGVRQIVNKNVREKIADLAVSTLQLNNPIRQPTKNWVLKRNRSKMAPASVGRLILLTAG